MSTATEIEITSSAKEAILYANTPTFLLDRLRKDASVRQLLDTHSPEEILGMLKESGRVQSPLELTRKYVLLVALLTSDWENRWKAAETVNVDDLEWGGIITNLAQAEDVPTTYEVVVSQDRPEDHQTFTWRSAAAENH